MRREHSFGRVCERTATNYSLSFLQRSDARSIRDVWMRNYQGTIEIASSVATDEMLATTLTLLLRARKYLSGNQLISSRPTVESRRTSERDILVFFPSSFSPHEYISPGDVEQERLDIPSVFDASLGGPIKMIRRFLKRFYEPIDRAETIFLRMKNLSVMLNQIVFLAVADRVLITEPKMTCLYTLMFYNVITYCVSYIKELIEKEDWSPYVTLTERSNIKHLAMSATKIVLEWTKAVTFIVTITFMLLVFGLEQGLENYKPSASYTVITWTYYSATEKVFAEMFPSILKFFQSETFESMEELYAPVILRIFTIVTSALFILILVPVASWRFLLVATYLNVYLRLKDLVQQSGATLQREREILNRYRKATREEIEEFDDVCAVCLCNMTKARITPCHHLFHADCLRQCLKASDTCPTCKRELILVR
ncbi:uncharacterized protein LOC128894119 isoform X1 [Hylaeus anthracinus]|uniref:uncharacterized protein LOC128894119 isoform X1 n=2 Tax=Hylaeus anthracinus TaxID=313031 RepID=UPI0023B9D618|nr:uncharacterized protein LOC128894119 isoform X1 [Hylaeus anthracinus]